MSPYPSPCTPVRLPPHQALLASAALTALALSVPGQLQFAELPRTGLPIDGDITSCVALADVDGDGDLDLVCGNWGQSRLYLNDGRGTFTDATATRMPTRIDTTLAVALGDVDGDGDLDLVIGNRPVGYLALGGQNRLYLNDGAGAFSDKTAGRLLVANEWTNAVALGDVDGDGDLDLVFGNGQRYMPQQNRLLVNDGAGTFTDATAQLPTDADNTAAVALGDVDGDGDLDMALANGTHSYLSGGLYHYGQQNRLYLNDGTGTFSDATATRMPIDGDNARAVALGDFDGDGDLDIVLGCGPVYWPGSQNKLYLNNGGVFTDATAGNLPFDAASTSSVAVEDADGDGDLDLVFGNIGSFCCPSWSDQTRLCLNDGTGVFRDATAARLPAASEATNSVAIGDLDGDGDVEVVLGNAGQNRLLHALQRQLHAPMAPQIGQPYSLDAYLRYGPPSTIDLALIYLSTAPASIPLGALGTLGIDPAMAAPFPTLIIPQPAGVGSVGFTVPNVPTLIGQELYSQALLVAYPNDLRLSNVVRDVIQ